jgi:hypothetical protein
VISRQGQLKSTKRIISKERLKQKKKKGVLNQASAVPNLLSIMDNNLITAAAASAMSNGDIWSTGFLSFESPLKDLLDSGDYTLEQILCEDELLQELRGMHPQLLLFFSTEQCVMRLLQHIIRDVNADEPLPELSVATVLKPPEEEDEAKAQEATDDTSSGGKQKEETGGEPTAANSFFPSPEEPPKKQEKTAEEKLNLQNIRYPYMACEVICCEINSILDVLVDGHVVREMLPENSDRSTNTAQDGTTEEAEQDEESTRTNGGTLPATTDPRPPRLLDLLCSVLTNTEAGKLDDYRAGYLDKVFAVLSRARPQSMTQYVQDRGLDLLRDLIKHLYSHSIMQIVQRMLMPSGNTMEEDDEENRTFRCRWSESPQSIDLLLNSLLRDGSTDEDDSLDESQNASEVLMTLIQNSPLTSRHLVNLTTHPVLDRVVDAASVVDENQTLSPHESKLTSAMNVLESLILQLGGYGTVITMGVASQNKSPEDDNDSLDLAQHQAANLAKTDTLIELLPALLERLCGLLRHESTKSWTSPMQFAHHEPQALLGMSRLKVVRLLESLVLLGHSDVDRILCESEALEICLDLFWEFSWCSMLHQSVANLLVHVFEGANERALLQQYFLVKCNLLGRLMGSFEQEEEEKKHHVPPQAMEVEVVNSEPESTESVLGDADEVLPVSDDDVDVALEQQTTALAVTDDDEETDKMDSEEVNADDEPVPNLVEEVAKSDDSKSGTLPCPPSFEEKSAEESAEETRSHIPSFRMGYMGHVIIICQALVHASTQDPNESTEMGAVEHGMSSVDLDMSGSVEWSGSHEKGSGAAGQDAKPGSSTSLDYDQNESYKDEEADAKADPENSLVIAQLIESSPLRTRWEEFVTTTLSAETAIQSTPLGGLAGGSPGGDPLHSHAPDMNGQAEFEQDFIQGKGILVTGEVIDMDDNDLDMAATMMEALAGISRGPEGSDDAGARQPGDQSQDYVFDDPLGNRRFSRGDSDDEEEEDGSDAADLSGPRSPEASGKQADENDVPVMDLFAGNFSYEENKAETTKNVAAAAAPGDPGWSDFANFDDAFASAQSTSSDSDDEPELSVAVAESPVLEAPEKATAEADDIFGTSPPHPLLLAEDELESAENPVAAEESVASASSDGQEDPQEILAPAKAAESESSEEKRPASSEEVNED